MNHKWTSSVPIGQQSNGGARSRSLGMIQAHENGDHRHENEDSCSEFSSFSYSGWSFDNTHPPKRTCVKNNHTWKGMWMEEIKKRRFKIDIVWLRSYLLFLNFHSSGSHTLRLQSTTRWERGWQERYYPPHYWQYLIVKATILASLKTGKGISFGK